ncbi:MAG TPA: hypothetical protein VGX48_12535 [Pyrinomonadaceae bacterium]|jgi:hypothetical protein|nr:hypothetical protein [Pyrinomonadaceae bacterium]
MREQVNETVVCLCCGARAADVAPAPRDAGVTWRGERRVESFTRERGAAPRRRSGLAYGAGYAGLAYLFAFSFGPPWGWGFGFTVINPYGVPRLIPLWSLWAPMALVLAFAAARALDTSRDKEGALQALFGFFVGLFGTLLLTLYVWVPGWLPAVL